MNFKKTVITILFAAAGVAAHAAPLSYTIGGHSNDSFSLTATNTSISGDLVSGSYTNHYLAPDNWTGTYLAAIGSDKVTLGNVKSVSFEWGTPGVESPTVDTLGVIDSTGTITYFTAGPSSPGATGLGLNSNLNNQYVQFTAGTGTTITGLTFASSQAAFEAADFKVSPVPEPANVALLLAGLGLVGLKARKRRD